MRQNKSLNLILRYKANLITLSRFLLLFIAVLIFQFAPSTACSLLMISVILDYADGIVARKYNECTFFGFCIDWLSDISSSIVMYIWWAILEPHLIIIFLIFIVGELGSMAFDIIANAIHFKPVIKANEWTTYILKFTMESEKQGFCLSTLGYINMINYYICGVSRIIYLFTKSQFWWWSFVINLIPAIIYGLMHIAYIKNILNYWVERLNNDGKNQVFFKEK